MALTASETCRQIADIIDFESERFDICSWEHQDINCGTTACIAGHIALLHDDGMNRNQDLVYNMQDGSRNLKPDIEWRLRQGRRIGLRADAAEQIFNPGGSFWSRYNNDKRDDGFSAVLRQLEKELIDREDSSLIDIQELHQIAENAL